MDSASPFPSAAAMLLKLDVLSLRCLGCPPLEEAVLPPSLAPVVLFSDHKPGALTKPGGGVAAFDDLFPMASADQEAAPGVSEDMVTDCILSDRSFSIADHFGS